MENNVYELVEGLSCSDVYFLMREKYPESRKIREVFESKCGN